MLEPARSTHQIPQAVHRAVARAAFVMYLMAIAFLGALRVYESSVAHWATDRGLVAAELLWWLRLPVLAVAICGIIAVTLAIWQQQLGDVAKGESSVRARVRAYTFVPAAIILFVIPLYLAKL